MANSPTNIYLGGLRVNLVKNIVRYFVGSSKSSTFASLFKRHQTKEDWQSDRMRWTRNPVYPLPGIGGLNPSSSANDKRKSTDFLFLSPCPWLIDREKTGLRKNNIASLKTIQKIHSSAYSITAACMCHRKRLHQPSQAAAFFSSVGITHFSLFGEPCILLQISIAWCHTAD